MNSRKEIEEYLYYCQYQKQLDEKTIRAYKADLIHFIDYMEVKGTIDRENINAYLVKLHNLYKQKSVKRKVASIKAFYNYLEEEQRIALEEGRISEENQKKDINPLRFVKTKFKEEIVLPKSIPSKVIERMLCYLYSVKSCECISAWNEKLILRDIAVIETLFATGMRISELCSLKDEMFDLHEGILCIRGKGGKERFLHIANEDVLRTLERYRAKYRTDIKRHGYFFVNRYGDRLSDQSARRMIHKHTKEAEITMNITPHMFRHAFATLLLEEDVDIRYIQKMLGHASIVTTQIYTYVTSKKQQEILRVKHPRNQMLVENEKITQFCIE
ncbi:MAG: tyrosine-type recombinase/integrase [bacterium]|nr:tyrosine-type recombinase/integrase [bacterium]